MADWYDDWRARVNSGDNTPLPHDPNWWRDWSARAADVPVWDDPPSPAHEPPPDEQPRTLADIAAEAIRGGAKPQPPEPPPEQRSPFDWAD